MKVCAFTGHRKIKSEHMHKIGDLVSRAIEYAYREGCRDFCVGGALGFDTVAAKSVILFRISHPDTRLLVVAPCRNQADSWSEAQIAMYEYILSSADHVEYVSDDYVDGCMRKRNQRLVDLADMLVAYVSRDYSGAAQTVRMAKSAGKPVYNLYPTLDAG